LIRATDNEIKWKDASEECGTQFVGPELFGNCQPETCNASHAANKIENLGLGGQQFWINGYAILLFNIFVVDVKIDKLQISEI